MWLPELLLITFVPGALLFRAPVGGRDTRARLAAEERVFWSIVISVAWSSIVVLALAAASRYTFGTLLAANGLVSAAALLVWRDRLLYRGTAAPPGPGLVLPLALAGLGLALFFPVSEVIVGGKDPGVYVSEGLAIAKQGGLVIRDPLVAAIPTAARDLFFPPHHVRWYYSLRFMGFFLIDPTAGTVVGQFPHLYPAWIAIGYGLDGINGGLRAVGGWAILGLLAVYFAGARLLGRVPAFCASALLALSVVDVWFGRYPNSEMGLQALLFAGLLAFSRSHVEDDRFFAPVAGVVLGLLVFMRFDAVLAWAGVGATVVVLFFQGRRPRASFLVPMALAAAALAAYIWLVMRPGFSRFAVFFENLRPVHLALIGLAALGAVVLLALSHNRRLARVVTVWTPPLLAAAIVCAAVYAYFFRVPAGRLAPHDALSFRTFAWYVPRAGLVAAVAGFVLLSWKRFWRDPALLLVTTVYAFFVFYKIQIVPVHFWMARRFLPVILPAAFLLLAGGAFYGVWSRRQDDAADHAAGWAGRLRRGAMWALPLVFVALVGTSLARATRPILGHVEYRGVVPRLEKLAAEFGTRDLVIVESRRSSDLHVLALPLAYAFDNNVLVLNTPRPDRRVFRDFLAWARSRYRNVYFVGSGGTDLLSRAIAVVPVSTERFHVPEYESVWNGYPRNAQQKEFDFSIYRFVDPPAESAPFDLKVGTEDDLYVVRFHAKERPHNQSYRWTTESSYVTILGLTDRSTTLTLWMDDGGRPLSAGPATVTCYLDNRPIGEVTVTSGIMPYRFAIPADLAAAAAVREEPVLLRIVVSPWSPKTALGTSDARTLGVMVQRVAVQ
jgi:hypothetical protein